jgi:hypothetical protein
MGRSAMEISPSEDRWRINMASLDDRFAGILAEIEQEPTPYRLLELASMLQQAREGRRQRKRPN